MDFEEIWVRVEQAYGSCDTAEDFLEEIMRIWAEYGILCGEMYCSLEKAI